MRKSNIWLACGLLSAFGVWQLSAIAQQPEVKSRPGAANQEDLSDQIQDLTEQTSKVLELTAQLDANSDSEDGDASQELRRVKERLAQELKALEKQIQHRNDQKRRSDVDKQRADGERNRAEAAKKHAEAAEKHAIEIRRRVEKGTPPGDVLFNGPGPRFAGKDVREWVKGMPGQNFIIRSEVHGPQHRSPEDAKRLEEFRQLVGQYRNEKDGDRKQELRNSIREKLAAQVDSDLEARRNQLSQLEDRVQKLRGQLEKSEGSKDEAIDSLLRMLDGDEDAKPLSREWMDVLSANGGPRGPWNPNFSNDWNFQNGPHPVITTFRENQNHGPNQNALDVVVATEIPIEEAIRVPIAPLAPPVPVDPVEGVAPVAPLPPDEPKEPLAEIEDDIEVHVEAIP